MEKITHGILVNPYERTIEVVRLDEADKLQSVYKHLGCEIVEAVPSSSNGDAIYVDEEGLLKEGLRSFNWRGKPLFGKAILLGTDDEGEWCAPRSAFMDMIHDISWFPYFVTGSKKIFGEDDKEIV